MKQGQGHYKEAVANQNSKITKVNSTSLTL